ncbi:starch synthase [Bacillus solimangrovi]|uniref:Glycogen synthase n=1 Tax=Bacillus solimangrovi TaxID=1305675 RepID=A0A1E5LGC9_9BACI|nr:glycogen synthase GlgA [Bacillus solimangrovi]OEH93138.1 starch synthase [Bacillus solimangrovi]
MNILFVVSECVPFIKSGGLADVAGALPKQLKRLGHDVRVILPKYELIPSEYKNRMEFMSEFSVQVGWRKQYGGLMKLEHEGITYYFIDNEYYFKRSSLYGDYDDGERFAYFSHAVIKAIPYLEFNVEILHCHDWHTAIVNYLLNNQNHEHPSYESIRTVFTIHNLQFQGVFSKEMLNELLNLDEFHFTEENLEHYGQINFMKGGIKASDLITTVSPTYRNEIQIPYYGEGLDGFLRAYQYKLKGIVNGIDADLYNPNDDASITQTYSSETIDQKVVNKISLQGEMGLPQSEEVPMVVMVSRLTQQKGLDLVVRIFHEMIQNDVQFVLLGTGEKRFEHFFQQMEVEYPNKVKTLIGFNESLAHKIYAAADLFLMPSKFEPCGLGQLIALRYGAIPIVRETGGLNDTVQSYDEHTGNGNGFSFMNYNAHDLLFTIERALQFYRKKDMWKQIVTHAMEQDYSWEKSAKEYDELYRNLFV